MKIYLSGKISGLHINTAKNNFKNAEFSFLHGRMAREYPNCEVINPMKIKHHFKFYLGYMITDLYYLSKCDAIAMMFNWKDSKGARIEFKFAKLLKLKIIFL